MCRAKKPSSLTRTALEPSPSSERFTIAYNHSREPAGGGSGFHAFRGLAGNQLGFPLYSPTLRCRTNIIMAKVPGASLYRGSARHDAYSCHRQAKAFRFTSSLSHLPTGASLFTNIG